ncbi:MAG: DUF3866 family protein [Gaiellales bacterium]
MLTLRRGRVTGIAERVPGLVRLEVDGRPCIAYPRLTGPVALGDDVIVNTQALDLRLGSGGFDVLHANLSRGLDLPSDRGAHVMKLPYTSLQHAVRHAEEDTEPTVDLRGMPVVACTLHSQVAPVCAATAHRRRVAYVQLPGGALPVGLSDAIRSLRGAGLLDTTVAVGPCVDAELSCVSVASALGVLAARGFEVAVCSLGPGILGTGTALGHGALAAAEALRAASVLGGHPILVPRISTADARPRHRGVSHHTRSVLEFAPGEIVVAWPSGLPGAAEIPGTTEVDATGWEQACSGLRLATMGRGPTEEPWFFAAAYAAGLLAERAIQAGRP